LTITSKNGKLESVMLKNFSYTPILGWSVSRYGLFESCKRKYYYTYYGKYDPAYSRQKIDELKSMTSIPLEIGNIVHDINKALLERLQKSEQEIDQNSLFDFARKKTEEYCRSKKFAEIYYDEIKELDMEDLFGKVKVSLGNFLNSTRLHWLTKEAVSDKSKWLIEPPGFGETRLGGLKAYCKVDFLLPLGDTLFILDWKTGKADPVKHGKQLLGYAAWASFHFQTDSARINPIIVYLYPDYEERRVDISELDIRGFTDRVQRETEEMYEFCADVKENIPRSKEIFSKTDKKKFCNYCNFREFCRDA